MNVVVSIPIIISVVFIMKYSMVGENENESGCTNPLALNFNKFAKYSDYSCVMDERTFDSNSGILLGNSFIICEQDQEKTPTLKFHFPHGIINASNGIIISIAEPGIPISIESDEDRDDASDILKFDNHDDKFYITPPNLQISNREKYISEIFRIYSKERNDGDDDDDDGDDDESIIQDLSLEISSDIIINNNINESNEIINLALFILPRKETKWNVISTSLSNDSNGNDNNSNNDISNVAQCKIEILQRSLFLHCHHLNTILDSLNFRAAIALIINNNRSKGNFVTLNRSINNSNHTTATSNKQTQMMSYNDVVIICSFVIVFLTVGIAGYFIFLYRRRKNSAMTTLTDTKLAGKYIDAFQI